SPATSPSPPELTRRQFLQLTSLAGSGLTLGIMLPGCGSQPGAGSAAGPLTMPFLRVAPDNTVTVISKHLEAGQGVWTGLPAIVAEELDASWAQIRVESAPAEVPTYQNMAFVPLGAHAQLTGGSPAVANSWQQLREAGAPARALLGAAAAARRGTGERVRCRHGESRRRSGRRGADPARRRGRRARHVVGEEGPRGVECDLG